MPTPLQQMLVRLLSLSYADLTTTITHSYSVYWNDIIQFLQDTDLNIALGAKVLKEIVRNRTAEVGSILADKCFSNGTIFELSMILLNPRKFLDLTPEDSRDFEQQCEYAATLYGGHGDYAYYGGVRSPDIENLRSILIELILISPKIDLTDKTNTGVGAAFYLLKDDLLVFKKSHGVISARICCPGALTKFDEVKQLLENPSPPIRKLASSLTLKSLQQAGGHKYKVGNEVHYMHTINAILSDKLRHILNLSRLKPKTNDRFTRLALSDFKRMKVKAKAIVSWFTAHYGDIVKLKQHEFSDRIDAIDSEHTSKGVILHYMSFVTEIEKLTKELTHLTDCKHTFPLSELIDPDTLTFYLKKFKENVADYWTQNSIEQWISKFKIAAIVSQKLFRGRRDRVVYSRKKNAAIKIQKLFRGHQINNQAMLLGLSFLKRIQQNWVRSVTICLGERDLGAHHHTLHAAMAHASLRNAMLWVWPAFSNPRSSCP